MLLLLAKIKKTKKIGANPIAHCVEVNLDGVS